MENGSSDDEKKKCIKALQECINLENALKQALEAASAASAPAASAPAAPAPAAPAPAAPAPTADEVCFALGNVCHDFDPTIMLPGDFTDDGELDMGRLFEIGVHGEALM